MASNAESTALAAAAFGMSADSATWSTNSLLFNFLPLTVRLKQLPYAPRW